MYDRNYLVEDFIEGDHFRILFCKGNMLGATKRIPANVKADGINSLKKLIHLDSQFWLTTKLEGCKMNTSPEDVVRKRRHLSAQEKYQIFLEATMAKAKGNGHVTEVLRRWGIHASDLTRIRKSVEEAAIGAFKARKSRKPKIDYDQHQHLKGEKQRLEATVLEQAAELALLKKQDRSA
jgi:hypothetical protein